MKDYQITINGQKYDVQINDLNETAKTAKVIVNGTTYDVEVEGMISAPKKTRPQVVASAPKATSDSILSKPIQQKKVAVGGHAITCPLPGTVVSIKVKVGDSVTAGQPLLVLEAMKMENNIDADLAGVVKEIVVENGATVMEGETLIILG